MTQKMTLRTNISARCAILILSMCATFMALHAAPPVDFWSVTPESPQVAKITIVRKYKADTRQNHPQTRILTAWWAPDSACLAWSTEMTYEPKEYGSGKWLPMRTDTDTVQADYSGEKIYYPQIERIFLDGFEKFHYPYSEDKTDKYGNWLKAYTHEFFNREEWVERHIEYVGNETDKTAAEIAHFQQIRDSGTQPEEARMSVQERINRGVEKVGTSLAYIFAMLSVIFAIVTGIYVWRKYRRWHKEFTGFGERYNRYSPLVWIASAIAFYTLPNAVTTPVLINPIFAIIAVPVNIAVTVWIFFFALPRVNNMLIYDRAIGRWGTTALLFINLVAAAFPLGALSMTYLSIFGPILVIVLACVYGAGLFYDQAFKCPECHAVDDTSLDGITFGGITSDNSQSHDDEINIDGDTIEKKHTHTKREDFYQRDVHNFRCSECGATWHRTFKGKYLGSNIKKTIETERRRLDLD